MIQSNSRTAVASSIFSSASLDPHLPIISQTLLDSALAVCHNPASSPTPHYLNQRYKKLTRVP